MKRGDDRVCVWKRQKQTQKGSMWKGEKDNSISFIQNVHTSWKVILEIKNQSPADQDCWEKRIVRQDTSIYCVTPTYQTVVTSLRKPGTGKPSNLSEAHKLSLMFATNTDLFCNPLTPEPRMWEFMTLKFYPMVHQTTCKTWKRLDFIFWLVYNAVANQIGTDLDLVPYEDWD